MALELPESFYSDDTEYQRFSDIVEHYTLPNYQYYTSLVEEYRNSKLIKIEMKKLVDGVLVTSAEIYECYSFAPGPEALTDATHMYIKLDEIQYKFVDTQFKKYIKTINQNKQYIRNRKALRLN